MKTQTKCTAAQCAQEYLKRIAELTGARQVRGGQAFTLSSNRKAGDSIRSMTARSGTRRYYKTKGSFNFSTHLNSFKFKSGQ